MQRGVGLPWAREKLFEEQNKGCGVEGGGGGLSRGKIECPDLTAQHTRRNSVIMCLLCLGRI